MKSNGEGAPPPIPEPWIRLVFIIMLMLDSYLETGRGEVIREDSGDSIESIGDLPIELPHLEGDLGVDHQMLW